MVPGRWLLTVRGYDRNSVMIDAAIVDGPTPASHLETLFARDDVAFVCLHYCRPGWLAAALTHA